jgi:hypothetical protein
MNSPEGTIIFWGSTSLLYSRDVQLIASAFARRISILVDKTTTLHLSGIICFVHKEKGKLLGNLQSK